MFKSKNKKNEYPCKPQFYYIKVGCKGVFISRTCLDINANVKIQIYKSQLSKKRVYITWTCLIVKLVKIDYYKCVFVSLSSC